MDVDNQWTVERIKQRLEKIKSEVDEIYIILDDLK